MIHCALHINWNTFNFLPLTDELDSFEMLSHGKGDWFGLINSGDGDDSLLKVESSDKLWQVVSNGREV